MSLQKIQANLRAPKGQYNSFAKFNYRSCEDILEAVKPLLAQFTYHLIVSDEMVEVGGRVYVKATATLIAEDGKWEATGWAREAETKKGMDVSQITGAASSYARKYALNGLFAIDDAKDADHNGANEKKEEVPPKEETPPPQQAAEKKAPAVMCQELLGQLNIEDRKEFKLAFPDKFEFMKKENLRKAYLKMEGFISTYKKKEEDNGIQEHTNQGT